MNRQISTLIKSNAFEIECPAEVLQFDLKVHGQKAGFGLGYGMPDTSTHHVRLPFL